MGEKRSIYSLTIDELEQWLADVNEPKYRAKQIYDWLYIKRVNAIEEMSNLSKNIRDKLLQNFNLTRLKKLIKQESKDGTEKYLFELYDGSSIETVLMRHEYGNSICVTTQVGCRMGCTFCASTLGGLTRNLEAGEIVSQILEVQKELDKTNERVSHVVVMGIGEPFDNYIELVNFLKVINSSSGLNIGARHITVSTSGIIPKIYDFADLGLQINFAISLHAANSELRTNLMPVNKAYPITELMKAVKYYIKKTGRRITFEYGLIGGKNDSEKDAEQLAALVKGIKCHINLIPVNYVQERDYKRTTKNQIFLFEKILKKHGINVTIRREQGHDIDAACGQLRAKERNDEMG
ncbi:MAG: ribosomal large subunit methyltransferase [Bacillales bacterium]|nr:ribosomal large subunit methyltransferase [Bacillales bacterium]